MKSSFLFCSVLLLCGVLLNAHSIPMQAHGFNELDYLSQLLVKGIDSFKIDINALDQETCKEYSTWKKGDNKCENDDWNIPICCLGFRGDTSSSPRLNDYFNTTTELVALFNNKKYDFIWQKDTRLPRYNRTIYIAMNVQYNYVQGELTKNWLYSMVQAIQKRNLDVQLIFGGTHTINYFGDSCKNKTKNCDDKAKTILSYPWVLQSDDTNAKPVPYGTVSNFNIEFPSIPKYCKTSFPAYGDNLPYFFYEIAHETDVQWIVNTYMDPKCNKRASHSDLSNVRITSNIDYEMVQSYLPQANYFDGIKNGESFLIETLQKDKLALLSYYDTAKKTTFVQIRSLESSEKLPLLSQTQIPNAKYTKMSYQAPYLLLTNHTHVQVFTLQSDPSIFLQSFYTAPSTALAHDLVVRTVLVKLSFLVKVEVEGSCPTGTLSFSFISLDTGKTVLSQCSDKIKAFNVSEIQSASLSVDPSPTGDVRGILFVSATYRTLSQTKNAIYAFSFKASLQSEFLPIQAFTVQTPTSFIDLGVDPSVKIFAEQGKLYVLEAHSNGISQNGNVYNNGNMFKCGLPSVDNFHYAFLQNVEYMLNYNWGTLESFEARIQKGKYVSACDSQIMHGKFYNGEKPVGTVYRNQDGILQAMFINQYVDYNRLPLVTKLFGGATKPFSAGTPESSVVVNTFDVLEYEVFSRL